MIPSRRLTVSVCGLNPATGYSGGRYHAWVMAEALAASGHDVTVWTNNVPAFQSDFSAMPGHGLLDVQTSPGFRALPAGPFDVVVLVPHQGDAHGFYDKVLFLALQNTARLVLLNFESANWFNSLSPEPRDPALWSGWLKASRAADMILSSARESTCFARDFYTNAPDRSLFRHCYPAINSLAADAVGTVPRERQVICIVRFGSTDRHKGGHEILKAIGPAVTGYTLAILIGTGTVDPETEHSLKTKAERFGVTLRFLHQLSDKDKFAEIKRSALMLFLSHFEGFGYPPVEALYCDTPCVVYDLPVLREVSGDALIYVPPGDQVALQAAIGQVLSGEYRLPFRLSEHIAPVARFDAYASRLEHLMQELVAESFPPAVTSVAARVHLGWRRRLFAAKVQAPWLCAARALRRCPCDAYCLLAGVLQRTLPPRVFESLRDQYHSLRSSCKR